MTRSTEQGFFDEEEAYWLGQAAEGLTSLPIDFDAAKTAVEADTRTLITRLDAEDTERFAQANSAYQTNTEDLLLVALARSLAVWADGDGDGGHFRIGMERHGRDDRANDLDLTSTTGWFTAYFPVTLTCQLSASLDQTIKRIKEQLRAVPNRGRGYGALRFLSKNPEIRARMSRLPGEQLLFNYLGSGIHIAKSQGGLFNSIRHEMQYARAPENRRPHALEINAAIQNGRLEVLWTYATEAVTSAEISELTTLFNSECRKVVEHCARPGSGSFTPSDFPEANVNQNTLDKLMDSLG